MDLHGPTLQPRLIFHNFLPEPPPQLCNTEPCASPTPTPPASLSFSQVLSAWNSLLPPYLPPHLPGERPSGLKTQHSGSPVYSKLSPPGDLCPPLTVMLGPLPTTVPLTLPPPGSVMAEVPRPSEQCLAESNAQPGSG